MLKYIYAIALSWNMLVAASPVWAQTAAVAPVLSLPVACTVGQECLVQKLVDLQPGPGRRDYRCGTLTTEDHDGIDIRLRTLADMQKGVAVVAAADGTVLRVRDGMQDENVREAGQDSIGGKQAGNGVVIAHGNGWETQYSHLRNGSVRVKPGDRVAAGTALGLVGMSGNAEFPHLHFTVRKEGVAIDPFLTAAAPQNCLAASQPQPTGLWSSTTAAMLRYTPTALIAAGFDQDRPDPATVRRRVSAVMQLPSGIPALVFWVDAFGVQAGDMEIVDIRGPRGDTVLTTQKEITKPSLSWFSFFGKKQPASGWPTGTYRAHYKLMRGGSEIGSISRDISITPK